MVLMKKILLGMLLLSLPVQVFAWDWHTKITISVKDQSLQSVCDILEQQYGIHFSYSRNIVNLSRKVTVNVRNKALKALLEELFQPDNITFARIGEQVVLTIKKSDQRTISGYVEDQRTGERLIGATVYSPSQQVGTVTNQYGFFSITLRADTCSLQASYIGYTPVRLPMHNIGKKLVIVPLLPLHSLQEVVVTETALTRDPSQIQLGRVNVSMSDVKSMPRLLGEADLIRTITALPGVSGGMDGGGALNVRGGSPDQNLVLLDGTPVFNASHLLGIFSIFNPGIVKNADFYKAAFPARYGGRLSSVLDVSMKDGNMQHYHGEGSVGLIAATAMVEGPIKKGKTSFLVSARRSFLDLLINPMYVSLSNDEDANSAYIYFYDANVKLNHIFSPKNRIYFSGYTGSDQFAIKQKHEEDETSGRAMYKEVTNTRFGWGNVATTLRWNHVFNPRLFSNVTLNFSSYSFMNDYQYNYESDSAADAVAQYGKYSTKISDGLLKIDLEYRPVPEHTIKFGGSGIGHLFNPGVSVLKNYYSTTPSVDTSYNQQATRGQEVAVYGEDAWNVNDALQLNIGVHAAAFLIDKSWHTSLQPRLGARYQLPHQWTLKASYTHMSQYLHLLADVGSSLPTDMWVPSTSRIKPMFSRQVSAGITKSSKDKMFVYSLEGYYKTMDHVIEYLEDAALFNVAARHWDEQITTGKGRSYGAELLLEKKKGTAKGWIGYTMAWSDRQFNEVNKGSRFPYKYDRRHDLEVVYMQQLSKKWELSASWEYSSGLPLTLPVASFEGINDSSPWGSGNLPVLDKISNRNQFRGKAQHRLDISATYTKQKKRWQKSWTFSVMNVYNKQNPFYYSVKTDREKQERYLSAMTILPILPSITYSVKF